MGKKAFDRIMAGIQDAQAYVRGDKSRARTHLVDISAGEISAARHALDLTREEFSTEFGISSGTLRKWETGERRPNGAARLLLRVIQHHPNVVRRVIREIHETT